MKITLSGTCILNIHNILELPIDPLLVYQDYFLTSPWVHSTALVLLA